MHYSVLNASRTEFGCGTGTVAGCTSIIVDLSCILYRTVHRSSQTRTAAGAAFSGDRGLRPSWTRRWWRSGTRVGRPWRSRQCCQWRREWAFGRRAGPSAPGTGTDAGNLVGDTATATPTATDTAVGRSMVPWGRSMDQSALRITIQVCHGTAVLHVASFVASKDLNICIGHNNDTVVT